MTTTHPMEVARGERFQFGENWTAFLATIDQRSVHQAERSIHDLLEKATLAGQTFLDIGCGSGLSSLAARRLGATVHSIDFDPKSVSCTAILRDRYSADDSGWTIEEGSALDPEYLHRLGVFDIVFSWGVLHHTGAMWTALQLAADRVAPGGTLVIALYNDQGVKSRAWRRIKRLYCSGRLARAAVLSAFLPYFAGRAVVASLVVHRHPTTYFTSYRSLRGMSAYHDWKDWLGGYPYEVAKPEEVLLALRAMDFSLVNLRTVSGLGCNEFVFRRTT